MVEPRASTGGVLIIIMIGCITLAVGITIKLFIYIHLLALTSRDCPQICVIVWPSDYCVIPH